MELIKALRLKPPCSVAFVGAGGKTTAMLRSARELVQRYNKAVLVTTTTHLGVDQVALGDWHIQVRSQVDLDQYVRAFPPGVMIFTGEEDELGRLRGLSDKILWRLKALAEESNLALLIEADGSRLHPLKAPAEHEPAIPDFSETVVVVCGLSSLGKPLTEQWVHRPEIFARLCGMRLGEMIPPEAIAQVVTHPEGGLKNIPISSRKLLLLNQADDELRQSAARKIAEQAKEVFDAVVIAALQPEGEISMEVTKAGGILAAYEDVAGIILAAGAARRLGRPKQLLEWRGETLIRSVVRRGIAAGLSPAVIVLGAYADDIRLVLEDLAVQIVVNKKWEQGLSSSVSAGVRSLPDSTGAAIFLLGDQPLVSVELIQKLVEVHRSSLAAIVCPMIDDRRSNPVLFDRDTFADLQNIHGDQGGRALFAKYPVQWLPWLDARVDLDVDTDQDYQRLLEEEGGSATS